MKPERPRRHSGTIGTPPNHRTAAMLGARGLRGAVGAATARRAMSTACVPLRSRPRAPAPADVPAELARGQLVFPKPAPVPVASWLAPKLARARRNDNTQRLQGPDPVLPRDVLLVRSGRACRRSPSTGSTPTHRAPSRRTRTTRSTLTNAGRWCVRLPPERARAQGTNAATTVVCC
jgi:hypothetical protein